MDDRSWQCINCDLKSLIGGITPGSHFVSRDPRRFTAHLQEHIDAGQKVPKRVMRRLEIDCDVFDLWNAGFVRSPRGWRLPAKLSLERRARTRWVSNKHGAKTEAWVPLWCLLIWTAGLDHNLPKKKRNKMLRAVASDRRKIDAMKAAIAANAPQHILFHIAGVT